MNPHTQAKADRIQQFVEQGKLEEALRELKDSYLRNHVISLLSRLHPLEGQQIKGTISGDEYRIERNKISAGISILLQHFQKGTRPDSGSPPHSLPKRLNKLPSPPVEFIGREAELEELKDLLQGAKPVLLLNGIGGIGKTSLALKYLYSQYDTYAHIAWISVPQRSLPRKEKDHS